MKSEFESREAFECIFGGEDGIDLSKDETGEYSFQPTRFAYSFFLVAWQQRQTEVDELQKRVDAVKGLAQTLWEKSEEKHQQGKVWESKTLGECADEILDVLEQVIKGGLND